MTGLASSMPPRLDTRGVQLSIGPFLVRVRSELAGVREHLKLFYTEFQMGDAVDGHFDVAIVRSSGPRRWVRPQATVLINGARPFLPLPSDLAGPLFEWGLNWCIGRNMHRWAVVHAAVVERGGRAMVFPAPPESGKSTLCAALSYGGWRLLSDEFALIDPDTGQAWPIPRPISLKEASIEIIRARHPQVVFGPERRDVNGSRFVHARPPAESVNQSNTPAVPTWIITPRYVAGSATTLVPVSKSQALVKLADQSFNYNFLGPAGYQCLADLVRRAECHSLEYSDLDDVLARLTDMTVH